MSDDVLYCVDPLLSTDLPGSSEEGGHTNIYFWMLFSVMMMFFFFGCAFIEKYKPAYGHETGATIIFGVMLSLILYAIEGDSLAATFHFKHGLFFNIFLPPIIFNAGFSMHKKMFFRNLGNVSMFGLVVTLLCFCIYSAASIFLIKMGLTMTNYEALNKDLTIPGEENP